MISASKVARIVRRDATLAHCLVGSFSIDVECLDLSAYLEHTPVDFGFNLCRLNSNSFPFCKRSRSLIRVAISSSAMLGHFLVLRLSPACRSVLEASMRCFVSIPETTTATMMSSLT